MVCSIMTIAGPVEGVLKAFERIVRKLQAVHASGGGSAVIAAAVQPPMMYPMASPSAVMPNMAVPGLPPSV